MAFDRSVDAGLFSEIEPCITSSFLSDEHAALVDFVYRLNSYNCTTKSGIVDIDEGNTRQDAQLLMSLLSSPKDESDKKASSCSASVSSSDCSYYSCSSESSKFRERNSFKFTCPSLSLETETFIPPKFSKTSNAHDIGIHHALLLGRPLRVDDRDALRLSSDAMARNVLKSFQKSIDSRVSSWIQVLSKELFLSEKEMRKSGASTDDIKALLHTTEADLIVRIRQAAGAISVTSVRTSFLVLPEKIDVETDFGAHGPDLKKQRVGNKVPREIKSSLEEQDDYQYTVTYRLKFRCDINLSTPAGFSEISLDVPGVIEGTFYTSNGQSDQIHSVVITIDTNILAAMMEKSCRTLVRASVAAIMGEGKYSGLNECTFNMDQGDVVKPLTRTPILEVTPSSAPHTVLVASRENRPVFVTPKSSVIHSMEHYSEPSSSSVLMPIPDDLADGQSSSVMPRRISPQPSPEIFSGSLLQHTCARKFNPRSQPIQPRLSRSSPPPSLFHTPEKNQSVKAKTTSSYRLPLISPTACDESYREVAVDDGPFMPSFSSRARDSTSLPMLVEAACRAMKSD